MNWKTLNFSITDLLSTIAMGSCNAGLSWRLDAYFSQLVLCQQLRPFAHRASMALAFSFQVAKPAARGRLGPQVNRTKPARSKLPKLEDHRDNLDMQNTRRDKKTR